MDPHLDAGALIATIAPDLAGRNGVGRGRDEAGAAILRVMARQTHRLHVSLRLRRPLEEVFPFFADARNLERITPPWLRFHVLTSGAIEMREGLAIDYRLRLRGIPIRWTGRISAWEPPHRFLDEQDRDPYVTWHHEHRFRVPLRPPPRALRHPGRRPRLRPGRVTRWRPTRRPGNAR